MRISDWSSDVCSSDLGRIKGIVGYLVPGLKGNRDGSELAHVAAHLYSVILFQPLLGDGASRNAGCGQAGRRTSASARVALAALAPIGVVGVARTNGVGNTAVVFAARLGIADQSSAGGGGGVWEEGGWG